MGDKMVKLPNDYFPHDFNARTDRKILRLRQVLGVEGYGIYWMLIETLATEEDFSYPISDIDLLSDTFGTSKEKVEAVVKQFGLFEIDKQAKFFSLSLIARMQKYIELSNKARKAAVIRWEKARKLKEMDAPALQSHSEGKAIKEKDIKEKKIIEEKKPSRNFVPPSFDEVKSYISEKKYNVDAENFIDFYSSKGWMVGKNKMKDWRASVRTWAKRDKGQKIEGAGRHTESYEKTQKMFKDNEELLKTVGKWDGKI